MALAACRIHAVGMRVGFLLLGLLECNQMSNFRYPDFGPSPDPRIGNGEWETIGHTLRDRVEAILAAGISIEATLVYFIVALRKLMEHAGNVDRATKFFLDWPLHATISRSASEILVEMNQALENGEPPDVIARNTGNKLSMDAFRDDLIHQLMRFELPTDAVRKMEPWLEFLQIYFRVIGDCPVLSGKKTLSQVDRLAVRVSDTPPRDVPMGAAFAFTINWTFLKDRDIVLEWNNEVVYPNDHKPGAVYQLHQA